MNLWTIVAIFIGILLFMSYARIGADGIKSDFIGSTIDSGKIVWEGSKDVYEGGKDIFEKVSSESTDSSEEKIWMELGKIPCVTDEDCNNMIDECENSCQCRENSCWK